MSHSNRREFIQQAAALAGGLVVRNSCWAEDAPHVPASELRELRSRLKGQLVLPDDPGYDLAKRVFYWNPRTERRPVAVVQCAAEEDAAQAIEFARENSLEVAVRSGGHSHLAWGSSHGVVIDLSGLKQISIDPVRRTVKAQAGVTGSEVASTAAAHGLVPVLGQCPGVSATGVTLGGGLGWLSGLFGACCDNLLSASLTTADSQILNVNAETNPELLWGMRGAGANFGVTTSFESQLHPLGTVLGGDIHYAVRDARAVLHGFREIMSNAPDSFQATLNLTPGERGLFMGVCHSGSEAQANTMLRRLRSIAPPTKEILKRQPFDQLAGKAAATNPGNAPAPAFRAIQTVYREQITDEVIDILIEQLAHATPDVIMGLSHYMHGEVCRIAPNATAFPHRQAHSIHLRVAYSWSNPGQNDEKFAWGETWRDQLRPQINERLYANYQTYQTREGSPSLFGDNHARLLQLKQQYDPTNLFRRNANIAPVKS